MNIHLQLHPGMKSFESEILSREESLDRHVGQRFFNTLHSSFRRQWFHGASVCIAIKAGLYLKAVREKRIGLRDEVNGVMFGLSRVPEVLTIKCI